MTGSGRRLVAVVFEALVNIARIFLGSVADIRILPQHLLKEEGKLGVSLFVIGLDAGKRIEKDRQRTPVKARMLA